MTKYVNDNGVSEMWLNIKNWVTSQLLGYSQTGHTHTKSQITDLDLSNYVDKTSNQTIGGVKKFSNIPIATSGNTYVSQINADRTNGTKTGFSSYNGFKVVCDNDSQAWNNTVFAIHLPVYSPTKAVVSFKLFDCIEGGTSYRGFSFSKNNDNYEFSPTASNSTDLGTSTNKWKAVYANNYYLGNTAFGNIVTHNASEFAQVGHTHSASDITDLETWNYDSNSNAIIVSGGTDTWSYDSQSNSIIVS